MHARRMIVFVTVVQSILGLAHLFLYKTWTFALPSSDAASPAWSRWVFSLLAVSFVGASLLAFRFTNSIVRTIYRTAAIWLGLLTFLALGAVIAWIAFAIASVAGFPMNFHRTVQWLFGAGVVVGICGILNASLTRITRTTVRLANLPDAWHGRTAALISDVHLGHVRNGGFLRRLVTKVLKEEPDAVFIAGDLYDGTAIDAQRAAEPLRKLVAPNGVYFVAGNHEQFGDDSQYLDAVAAAGVRVLSDEKVEVDGLQIIGVPYRNAAQNSRFASVLDSIPLDRERASILLVHAPDHPEIAEAAGVSLQLSGHTHLGQFVPWSWIARRVYRQFVYGLSRIGKMQVFTSSGAGTWGPPLRLGSNPEIVMLEFEQGS
ncbi:MAG TPA: metallophosphoesterase [Candidatus Angelobacter sp.]|nr:metallophosphoesterase [Candidatus Angelobacter sp.]